MVEDVYTKEAELGVLHFFDAQKDYFLNSFRSHSLSYQKHYEREFLLATSRANPLAGEREITKSMLEHFPSREPLSWSAERLLEKMLEIDWTEDIE